jgi:hypothetical protein
MRKLSQARHIHCLSSLKRVTEYIEKNFTVEDKRCYVTHAFIRNDRHESQLQVTRTRSLLHFLRKDLWRNVKRGWEGLWTQSLGPDLSGLAAHRPVICRP